MPTPSPTGDIEQRHRANRWGWMLDGGNLTAKPENLATYALETEAAFAQNPGDAYWESYSVSERAVNFLIVAARQQRMPRAHELEVLLEQGGRRLLGTLEYYGPRTTNNHLLNNARALYLIGAFARVAAFRDAGRAIFANELPRLVQDGSLREGSSHYHLLVQRWLLDVAWAAKATGDAPTLEIVEPVVLAMHQTGRLFSDPDQPCVTIGDVSPDASGEALKRTFEILHGTAWPPDDSLPRGIHRVGEWCRWEGEAASALWRLPRDPTPDYPTHAHADLGGCVLNVRGHAVLKDPGRLDYTKSPLGQYGASATAHSALLVDGFGMTPVGVGSFAPRTLSPVSAAVEAAGDAGHCRVTVTHDGFARVARGLEHRRIFDIDDSRLRIQDDLAGAGPRRVTLLYQIAPGLRVEGHDRRWTIAGAGSPIALGLVTGENVGLVASVAIGEERPEPSGWLFPDYGVRLPMTTLRFEISADLPMQIVTTIDWT